MTRSDQPISIIGVLFALSIAFWGNNMVEYVQKEVPWRGYRITDNVIMKFKKIDGFTKIYDIKKLEKKELRDVPFLSAEEFEDKLKDARKPVAARDQKLAAEARRKLLLAAGDWIRPRTKVSTTPIDGFFSALIILAGLAFLADIACVMWWYARYIYIIHPTPTLSTHFLDFGVCAAFNLAANAWTDPRVFLTATIAATGLLLARFRLLYNSPEASGSDKYILSSAMRWMKSAALFSLLGLMTGGVLIFIYNVMQRETFYRLLHPLLLLALSGIGICLTATFAGRIRASADMHENRQRRFKPMELHWPKNLLDDADSKKRITQGARKGLDKFRNLFSATGVQHDRLLSRVHAEADLRVQSYILAVPSWKAPEKKGSEARVGKEEGHEVAASHGEVRDGEVERKAFIVGVSHWLDDLLDGREELAVYRKVKEWIDSVTTFDVTENRRIFESIYRDYVISQTDPPFYEKLVNEIESSVSLPGNLPYLYFGLNRVAIGAALFSPRLSYSDRKKLLRSHSSMLARLVAAQPGGGNSEWFKRVNGLLVDIQEREGDLGNYLLGLTTKTALEMGMASEGQPLHFGLSVLYSLLFAPMLYFHDIDEEVRAGEMAALETFNVNYETIVPWIEDIYKFFDANDAPPDDRLRSRLLQVEMTFRCFEIHLPQVGKDDLEKIYLGKQKTALPTS